MTPVAVTGLGHRYGAVPAVDGVTFDVPGGTLTALVGPTGCGKSTILRILAGLVRPTAGDATIDGASVAGRTGRAAYMPQGDTLLPWRTALANATLGAELSGGDRRVHADRARGLFGRFGLAGFEDTWPAALSGGMRQRVALLRTVMADRPVLLLDEPFGALDAITRLDLQGWLADLLAHAPRTVVLVTHDVDEALRLADEVLVLSPRPGRIVDAVTVDAARPRPPTRLTDPDFATLKHRILVTLDAASR